MGSRWRHSVGSPHSGVPGEEDSHLGRFKIRPRELQAGAPGSASSTTWSPKQEGSLSLTGVALKNQPKERIKTSICGLWPHSFFGCCFLQGGDWLVCVPEALSVSLPQLPSLHLGPESNIRPLSLNRDHHVILTSGDAQARPRVTPPSIFCYP